VKDRHPASPGGDDAQRKLIVFALDPRPWGKNNLCQPSDFHLLHNKTFTFLHNNISDNLPDYSYLLLISVSTKRVSINKLFFLVLTMARFTDLPMEVLMNIANHLQNQADVLDLALVSKAWNAAATERLYQSKSIVVADKKRMWNTTYLQSATERNINRLTQTLRLKAFKNLSHHSSLCVQMIILRCRKHVPGS